MLGIPESPVVRTQCFQFWGSGFIAWLGSKILQAVWYAPHTLKKYSKMLHLHSVS